MSLKKIEEKIVVVLLALLIVLVFSSATLRWANVSMAWSVDIAQLLFAWICFIGADLALRNKGHVGVDMLTKKMPYGMRNIISLINNILIIGFLGITFFYGSRLCIENYARTFNTIPISYSLVTLSVPVGSLLMILTTVGNIMRNIGSAINRDYSDYAAKEELEGGQIL